LEVLRARESRAAGCTAPAGLVGESVLAPGARVGEGASVKRAMVLHHARIGPRAVIRHVIVDENALVPGGVQVGVDKQTSPPSGQRSARSGHAPNAAAPVTRS
jgi:glucose-1-phosphate adenylyltransferase